MSAKKRNWRQRGDAGLVWVLHQTPPFQVQVQSRPLLLNLSGFVSLSGQGKPDA